MEERFKKRLQDDISHHFSHQSLILSILLIGLFLVFSLAPQQIGLYQDLKAVEHSYHQLIRQNKAFLTELNQHILTKFVNHQLSSSDLSKQYYHLRNRSQSQSELLVFDANSHMLFASNQHLGNFFRNAVYMTEVLKKARQRSSLLRISMDNEEGHYLLLIKPIKIDHQVKGYSLLVMNGKDFLQLSHQIASDFVIADQLDNSFAFTNRTFMTSSLNKLDSHFLKGYFIFHEHHAFILRKVALSPSITLYSYRPLIPVSIALLFSLMSSVMIYAILYWKSKALATQIASSNSAAINQMVLDMQAISRQEKNAIDLQSQDEFQCLSVQINQMISRLQALHQKTLALEKQNVSFEKRMLEAQFNPHFLYNTLETILITSHYDSDLTEKIVLQLTKLLRYSLDESQEAVCLGEDLAVLESYLLISQIRFEELRYTIAVEPALETLRVPKLFLLPLVENAIKYGLRYRHDLVIEISVRRIADAIYFTVADNGPGISQKRQADIKELLHSEDSHHGLVNSYRRLKHQFTKVELIFCQRDERFLLTYVVKE
ncbi:TPA: sensor histidine kinase [Streptococcus equi subsp. zooepidemicus]|nr:sensor histidine kinase [Streptococcus equi subsp. zooepidemicus]